MAKDGKKAKNTEKILKNVSLTSLGCAKNFVETELAAASFIQGGFGLVSPDMEENIRYINTCAFLKSARKEAANHIHEAQEWKKKKKGRMICVGGCLVAHTNVEELKKEFPLVDIFIGIDDTVNTGKLLKKYMQNKEFSSSGCSKEFLYECDTPRLQLTPSHYAYLKISDGCDNCCTYCLIPSIRGRLRSRKISSIVQEAKNLVSSGVKELIIIAQDTSAYGKDLTNGKSLLPELLQELDKIGGDHLLRLMYLHPAGITDELISVLKKMKHLIKCLEMPIQHIDDTVLKNMNRKIFEEDTRNVLQKLKKASFALRTTFMTGYPGETEEAFQKVLDLVKEFKFQRLGVFAYSPEKGTVGEKMKERPAAKIGEARRKAILKEQAKISGEYNKKLLGKKVEVIIDAPEVENVWVGRTIIDAPDIDNLVYVESFHKVLAPGMRVKALVKHTSEYDILAEYIP